MKKAVNIAVTGAAGNISYALLFRIASGDMLGDDQLINLQLLEITPAMKALEGIVMELNDCAFPLINSITTSDDANVAFKDVDYALLVGSKPRGPGMERGDLLKDNGKIFSVQGKALNDYAACDVKVLVVGNPANTNALIAAANAPDLDSRQFTAMTRLDHNRAKSQIATKLAKHAKDIKRVTIWGNHSTTQYPDIDHTQIDGQSIVSQVDQQWLEDEFIPTVQKRGTEIIAARGVSSAASAASAAVDHMRDWALGTKESDWVSMGIPSDGSYGIEPGIIYSYPVVCANGQYEIVQGLSISEFSLNKMQITEKELREEKLEVDHLL